MGKFYSEQRLGDASENVHVLLESTETGELRIYDFQNDSDNGAS